ncbi:MAG: MYXO-CTERM sorting domain-containing protein [Polyangiaceae bacterium]
MLKHLLGGLTLACASFAYSSSALACDGSNPERYRSEQTVWCVDPQVWSDHQADIERFFGYGDDVIKKLTDVFGVSPDGLPFSIVAKAPDGYAQTPSRYGPGVEVTGDAFYNDFGGVSGFWGYLLVLHEFVNQWTGLVTAGWPTDWWADHRSPFPNAMDELVMRELGHGDAADQQHQRMLSDAQVQLFLNIFNRQDYGFKGYQEAFGLIQGDGLHWTDLRDPPGYDTRNDCVSGNPSQLLGEYVTAYLSIPAREDLTQQMTDAGVGQVVDNLCPAYSLSSQNVGDIADAHCAIGAAKAAGVDVGPALGELRRGNFAGADVQGYTCSQHCPTECACDSQSGRCVAPWRGDSPPAGTGGTGGASNSGGFGGEGAAPGSGGTGAESTGGSQTSGGSGGTTNAGGSAGAGHFMPVTSGSDDSSCSCRVPGGKRSAHHGALWLVLGALLIGTRRRTRRD